MSRNLNTAFLLLLAGALAAVAQDPLPHRIQSVSIDSGPRTNNSATRGAVFSERIRVDGATWLRLSFDDTSLAQGAGEQKGAALRITSTLDGAVQTLDAEELIEWRSTSAFFNGDEVLLELIAEPGTGPSRVRVTEVTVGEVHEAQRSICGPTDDRTPSADARDARIVPVGCSVWLIDDAEGCFLTAGHCVGASFSVVEFNVPTSNADGSLNHPPPQDQYPVDAASLVWDQTVIGNDWAYFGAFPNADTEMTPSEAQGVSYTLGLPPAVPSGETIRITGYGSTDGVLSPLTLNQVQKTHTGPLTSVSGTVLQYAVDTTGGNSGSAIFNETTGEAIGIHTNAGCSAGGGANNGMGLNNLALQNALAAPVGICASGPPPVRVVLDAPLPDLLDPTGDMFDVQIIDRNGAPVVPTSAEVTYDAGLGDQTAALSAAPGDLWRATFPAMDCGDEVTFKIEAVSGGVTVHHPFSAENSADRRYRRFVGTDFDTTFRDDFETDMGWTVADDPSLSDGSWERGIPSGYGLRGDPPWDADSSGSLYATNLAGGNNDVDGGPTTLTSPTLDATGADPHISYWRWFDDGGASDDSMVVEVSDDNGGSWVKVETVGPNLVGSWVRQTVPVADFVTPNNLFRIRFIVSDTGAGNIIEAAVDGVMLQNEASPVTCNLPPDPPNPDFPAYFLDGPGANGRPYQFLPSGGISWEDARDEAAALAIVGSSCPPGNLATVSSQEENDFLISLLPDALGEGWLGGYQPSPGGAGEPDGGWEWITGEAWSFTNWAAGEPDNFGNSEHWLSIYRGGNTPPLPGKWKDQVNPSGAIEGYFVEWDCVCGDIDLDNLTIDTTEVYQACGTLTAGPAFTVTAAGDVTFASSVVVLENGVTLGGTFAVEP